MLDLAKDLERKSSFAKGPCSTFCADSCGREESSAGSKGLDIVGTQVDSDLEIKSATIFHLCVDKCRGEECSFDWKEKYML